MKYLKKFQNHSQYESYIASGYAKPNVSYCVQESDVHYNPMTMADKYLTFTALEDTTFKLTIGSAVSESILSSISYSTDNGKTWNTTNNVDSETVTITTPTINTGNKVLWKGIGTGVSTTIDNNNRPTTSSIFSSSGEFNVEGNIMSLIYDDDFSDKKSVQGTYNFALLFYSYNTTDTAKVVSAKDMVLPIKSVPTCGYFRMFQGCPLLEEAPLSIDAISIGASGCMSTFWTCPSLTTAPELPATTLSDSSYKAMFEGCSGLTTAPSILSATTLGDSCYSHTFNGCTSLTTAPSSIGSSSTTMVASACTNMFYQCTSLTTAPELPATTLGNWCYFDMFYQCTSLTTAPELPATTLANSCYEYMFFGCTNLTTAPELPATTLKSECYESMFYQCSGLTTAPELPAINLTSRCYLQMFRGCTSLTIAPVMHASKMASQSCFYMFMGCKSLATAPTLSATTLEYECYEGMFNGCTSLTTAPDLPATTLQSSCYWQMFKGCTSLTTAPDLPATTLAGSCYYEMFRNCSKLNYIKAMFTTTPSTSYTRDWVNGVAANGTFVKNSAAQWDVRGVNGVPANWTVETVSE